MQPTLRQVFYLSGLTRTMRDDPHRDYTSKSGRGAHSQAVIALARRRVDVLWLYSATKRSLS
jgi:hypothetical protein